MSTTVVSLVGLDYVRLPLAGSMPNAVRTSSLGVLPRETTARLPR